MLLIYKIISIISQIHKIFNKFAKKSLPPQANSTKKPPKNYPTR